MTFWQILSIFALFGLFGLLVWAMVVSARPQDKRDLPPEEK